MGRSISMFIILANFAISQNEVNAMMGTFRILNGTDAEDGEFPYMVQVITDSFSGCGGSIIGPEWILTAAHCDPDKVELIAYGSNQFYEAGDNDLHTNKVKKAFAHPKYTFLEDVPFYDVALLQLEKPLEFNDDVQPVELPDNEYVPFHAFGILTGWGKIEHEGGRPENLQKVSLQLLNDQECAKKITGFKPDSHFNSTHHICSDNYWNGQCYGDSGGPFVINGIQYGVVSWSYKPCGIISGVYSRITNPEYRNWIRDITGI